MNINYREVNIDTNGKGFDKNNKNPLTKRYQYEYALYQVVSDLFALAVPKSKRIDSLKLYFKELPIKPMQDDSEGGRKRKSQEEILDEMKALVARDVIGHIKFPMMNECAVEVLTKKDRDGANIFVFTDGVYGFMLRLDMNRPKRIEVCNKRQKTENSSKEASTNDDAKLKGVA